MYLCACPRASLISVRRSTSHLSASASLVCLFPLLPTPHRMYLMRIVRSARAAVLFLGRLLLICLLLDTFYLACVYDAAPLPLRLNDNASEFVNRSSDVPSGATSRSSSLSLAPQLAAPSAALLPSSSSLSSSKLVDEKHRGNISFNETERYIIESESDSTDNASSDTLNPHTKRGRANNNKQAVSSPRTGKTRKEFPLALVVASATAAVSILVFFCVSYLWHTRQLDRRAQKLAIRLAAEANSNLKCSQCRSVPTYRMGSIQDSGSDSGGEDARVLPIPTTVLDELNSLNEEDEEEGEDGSRRKPGGVGRTLGNRRGSRGRGGRRSGSRSSRKWSGHSGQTRSSLVTDQEILNHFASRRHSTFFI